MEDHIFLHCASDASRLHAHDMHFRGSTVGSSSPPPPYPPSPLHSLHDFLEPIISPLPLSYALDSLLPSQCAHESSETTDSINAHKRHAHKSDDKICINHSFEEVKLDLSLGSGGHHQELHGLLARGTSLAAEQSASSVTELDRSTKYSLAAAELSPGASFLAFKSSEGTPWESTSSSSFNHRLASTMSHQTVGDFDELSPITAKGHSVFQVRVNRSQAFPFVTGALHEDGASHEEKVFFCKFCDRRFHSSQALGGHQNAHKRERLVARSSPARFGAPAVFCAMPGSMPFQLPTCSMQAQHAGCASEERPLAAYPLIASMCRDRSHAPLPPLQAPSMYKDGCEAPPALVSSMCTSKLELDCLPSSNVYMENRSLGIKAHSLVHKPSAGHSFAPQMGHLKVINVISAPGRASTTHHGWSTASMDAQPGVARCSTLGQDRHVQQSSLQHGTRFFLHMMKDESAGLLQPHHRQRTPFHTSRAQPPASHSNSLKPCIKSGSSFLHELDSSSSKVVDLALHL